MDPNKIIKVGVLGWAVSLVIWLGTIGGIAYAVIHFVHKYW